MDELATSPAETVFSSQTIRRISFSYMPEDEIEWSVVMGNGQRLNCHSKEEAERLDARYLDAHIENRLKWRPA